MDPQRFVAWGYALRTRGGAPQESGRALGRRPICRFGDPDDECVDGFAVPTTRQHESSIVGFACSIGVDRLIDHEVTAVALHGPFEALPCLEKLDKLLVGFSPNEAHAART